LAQPVPTVNPFTRLTVKENRGLARVEEFPYSGAPAFREPSVAKDVNQTVPVDTVEGLMEIKLRMTVGSDDGSNSGVGQRHKQKYRRWSGQGRSQLDHYWRGMAHEAVAE
jgi:hypothetical protein